MAESPRPDRSAFARSLGRTRIVWSVLAVLGLAVYLHVAGIAAVAATLRRLSPGEAGLLVVVGTLPVFLWGIGLYLLAVRLNLALRPRQAIALFWASVFLNNVTPFGPAGGDPLSGLLAAVVSETRFERGLSAIVVVNTVNRVAAFVLGIVGTAFVFGTIVDDRTLLPTVGGFLAFSAVAGAAVAFAWTRRHRVARRATGAIAGLGRFLERAIPRFDAPSRESVADRVEGFVGAIEHVGADPRRLAAVFSLSIAGQVAVGACLWLSILAVGARVPVALVFLILPVAKISGFVPTPGGTAGAEAIVAGLLVAGAGVSLPVAAAAALVYRAVAFWLPTVGGAIATVGLLLAADTDSPPTGR